MSNQYICTDIYTVRAGDTLYSIAQYYHTDVQLLMRANRIRNPYNLRIGTRLCIPGSVPDAPEAPAPQPETPQCEPSGPSCESIHVVKEGDTLYMIAKQHGVTLDALMKANSHIDPYNMQIGMEICVPHCQK